MGLCQSYEAALSPTSPPRQPLSPVFKLSASQKFSFPTILQTPRSNSPLGAVNMKRTFIVKLVRNDNTPSFCLNWPDTVKLRVSFESIIILTQWSEKPIYHIPYYLLPGWKGTSRNIVLKVMNSANCKDIVKLCFDTLEGKAIQSSMICSVECFRSKQLDCVVDDADFQVIIETILDSERRLQNNWICDCDFELGGRRFSAQQAMILIASVRQNNFDDIFSLSCYLYYRVLCRESFSFILSAVQNTTYRKNISNKLGSKHIKKNDSAWPDSSVDVSHINSDDSESSFNQTQTSLKYLYESDPPGF